MVMLPDLFDFLVKDHECTELRLIAFLIAHFNLLSELESFTYVSKKCLLLSTVV